VENPSERTAAEERVDAGLEIRLEAAALQVLDPRGRMFAREQMRPSFTVSEESDTWVRQRTDHSRGQWDDASVLFTVAGVLHIAP